MKNPIPWALACCATMFVLLTSSCSKNDSSNISTGDIVAGEWKFQQVDYHYYYDGRFYDTTSQFPDGGKYIQFKSDSSVYTNTDSLYTGKWAHNRDKLILTGGGYSSVFQIRALTESELVLYIKDDVIDGYSESVWHLKR